MIPFSIWRAGVSSAHKEERKSMKANSGDDISFSIPYKMTRMLKELRVTHRERMSGLVDSKGKILNLLRPLLANNFLRLLGRDVLVVKTLRRFRGWLLNVCLSPIVKECSKAGYGGPALEILAGVDLVKE